MTINDDFINHFLRGAAVASPATVYLGLFTVAPGSLAMDGGVEVAGGSYARQSVILSAPVGGLSSNTTALEFAGMPTANVVGSALFDALTGGTFIRGARMSVRVVTVGKSFFVPIGSLIVQVR